VAGDHEKTGSGRNLWSLDEYVVVADLYLRRGRSSGVHDHEVLALAQLTGRTPASISRRLGNFAGTKAAGVGLKPVTGDALEAFEWMESDDALREQMVRDAWTRLSGLAEPGPSATATWRLVPPEQIWNETFHSETTISEREGKRREAALVRRYRDWLDPSRERLSGVLIEAPQQTLRCDLLDIRLHRLIEAKADSGRDSVRYAIGQLLDYQRFIDPRPGLALLVPARPAVDLLSLLTELTIDAIWWEGSRFTAAAAEVFSDVDR